MAITKVFVICNAYESGYGHGYEHDKLCNPFDKNTDEHEAYNIGYHTALCKRLRNKIPQGNSPEIYEAMTAAFKELLALSPEQLRDKLKNTSTGPIHDLVKNQTDLDPEFSKTVDENFWELI